MDFVNATNIGNKSENLNLISFFDGIKLFTSSGKLDAFFIFMATMIDLILTILYTLIFLWMIRKIPFFKIPEIPFPILSSLFIIKILSGIVLIIIYTYYYGNDRLNSDIFKYFDDGNVLFSALRENPVDYFKMLTGIGSDAPHLMKYYDEMGFWIKPFDYNLYNDNRTVIRFNALVRIFSFGSIYVHNVFINFLSFTGFVAILKVFYTFFMKYKYLLLGLIFLVPSTLLWSSGLLKEGILMFAFGLFFYSSIKIIQYFEWKHFIIFSFSILLLLISKFYVLIAAVPGFITYFFLHKTSHKYHLLKFLLAHFIFFLLATNFHLVFPKYNVLDIIVNKQHDFEAMVKATDYVGSYYQIPKLESSFLSFLKNSPVALYNTLTRPYITEVYSPLVLMAALENIGILFCIFLSIVFFRKESLRNPIIYYLISFVIIEFILCGLTTPVLGALVRYKMPALPFLFVFLMYITDMDRIKRKLNLIKIRKP